MQFRALIVNPSTSLLILASIEYRLTQTSCGRYLIGNLTKIGYAAQVSGAYGHLMGVVVASFGKTVADMVAIYLKRQLQIAALRLAAKDHPDFMGWLVVRVGSGIIVEIG